MERKHKLLHKSITIGGLKNTQLVITLTSTHSSPLLPSPAPSAPVAVRQVRAHQGGNASLHYQRPSNAGHAAAAQRAPYRAGRRHVQRDDRQNLRHAVRHLPRLRGGRHQRRCRRRAESDAAAESIAVAARGGQRAGEAAVAEHAAPVARQLRGERFLACFVWRRSHAASDSVRRAEVFSVRLGVCNRFLINQ